MYPYQTYFTLHVVDLNIGKNGFAILYPVPHRWYSGSGIGDINGDKISDMAVTMHSELGTTGYSLVLLGQKKVSSFPSSESAVDGHNGFIVMVSNT